MGCAIKNGLPEGVTLICNDPYKKSIRKTYTLYVKKVPVAYVSEYDCQYYEQWRVFNYLTDDKKFVDDIMDKYREYCEDVWRQKHEEFKKHVELREKSLRNSANVVIEKFKKNLF